MAKQASTRDLLRQALRDHPEVASAALLAVAVDQDVLDREEAERLAETLPLDDFEGVSAELTVRVEEKGRTQELVEWITRIRRVGKLAGDLLERSRR